MHLDRLQSAKNHVQGLQLEKTVLRSLSRRKTLHVSLKVEKMQNHLHFRPRRILLHHLEGAWTIFENPCRPRALNTDLRLEIVEIRHGKWIEMARGGSDAHWREKQSTATPTASGQKSFCSNETYSNSYRDWETDRKSVV